MENYPETEPVAVTAQTILSDKHLTGELIDLVVYLAPFIQKLVPLDCMIGVSDTEKFLSVVNGKDIKLPFDVSYAVLPRIPIF